MHTAEMLLRQSRGVVDEWGPDPDAAGLMDDVAAVLNALAGSVRHWHPPWLARTRAKDLAADCAPHLAQPEEWRHSALLSVLRSMAIDLLQLTGLSRDQARYYLPGTGTDVSSLSVRGDEESGVWGTDEPLVVDDLPDSERHDAADERRD
jgi:hypothetical protein